MFAIGQVSKDTGLKVPTIRFYEQEGLLAAPERSASGRRVYSASDVRRLAFIRHARALGFELDDIRSLLDLTDHPERPCAEADAIARTHLAVVEERLAMLNDLKHELTRIVKSCAGANSAGECRVIEALAGHNLCESDHVAETKKKKKSSSRKPRSSSSA